MSEKPPNFVRPFKSEHINYEMDPAEVRAVQLAHDPVRYLQRYLHFLENEKVDLAAIPFDVISEVNSLADIVMVDDMKMHHPAFKVYVEEPDTQAGRKALFALMKEVGLSYTQLVGWVRSEDEEDGLEERLENRGDMIALREVYEQ